MKEKKKEDRVNIVLYKKINCKKNKGRDFFQVEIECPICTEVQVKEATISNSSKLCFKKTENKHCSKCGVLFCL